VSGERGDREEARQRKEHPRGLARHLVFRRHEYLGPRPLVLQGHRVGQDLVADAEPGDTRSDGADRPGGFHAERHRRYAANVPAASSHDVIPIANASGVNRDEELSRVRDLGLWQLQALDRISVGVYPCASHVPRLLSRIGLALVCHEGDRRPEYHAANSWPWQRECRRFEVAARLRLLLSGHQVALALRERAESLIRRYFLQQPVIVPRAFRLSHGLDLVQIKRVQLASIYTNSSFAEERIIGRHRLHLGDNCLAVRIALQLGDRF